MGCRNLSIQAIECFLPETRKTIDEIVHLSGIAKEKIYDSIEILEKPVASDTETAIDLAIQAVFKLIKSTDFDPKELDYIIYASSGIDDSQLRSPSAKIQHLIGAKNAFCFELSNGCNSLHTALHVVKNLLNIENNSIALLVISDTLSKFIDYSNTDILHLFSFSDGATAILVNNFSNKNIIISSSLITDGSFSDCAKVDYSNEEKSNDNFSYKSKYLIVNLNKNMRSSFYESLIQNYIRVISNCLKIAAINAENVCYFLLGHNNKTILKEVSNYFHITSERTINLSKNLGHVGSIDTAILLMKCIKENLINTGDYIIISGAGIGYNWGAHLLQI